MNNQYVFAKNPIDFTEETIQGLFGHEAAEDEDIVRLRSYYIKSDFYASVLSNTKLKIIVGHKGIGKSALFAVAADELAENFVLTVKLKPDDIADIKAAGQDFLTEIRIWKKGLEDIIHDKVFDFFLQKKPKIKKVKDIILNIVKTVSPFEKTIDSDRLSKIIVTLKSSSNPRIVVFIDDLDRGWEGKTQDIKRISALINAIRDISNENPNIHFRISLRTGGLTSKV